MTQYQNMPWLASEIHFWREGQQANQLGHAYLWTGLAGLGKTQLINCLGKALLCKAVDAPCGECQSCHWIVQGTHPDFYEAPPTGSIGIETIRQWTESVHKTPMIGERIVIVVPDCDRMTLPAANAMLKVLEEPPSYCVWLLSTSQMTRLPTTIVSRVQQRQLVAATEQQCQQWLQDRKVSAEPEAFALAQQLYGNAPLGIEKFLTSGAVATRQAFCDTLTDFMDSKVSLEKTYQACWPKYKQELLTWVMALVSDGIHCQLNQARIGGDAAQTSMVQKIAVCSQQAVWQWYDELMVYRRAGAIPLNFAYWFYTWLYFLKREVSRGIRV